MKIVSVETIVTRQPLARARGYGVGALDAIDAVIVRLYTDAKIEGVGEASVWPVFNDNPFSVREAIDRYLGPAVVGLSPLDTEAVVQRMDMALHGERAAKAGVEMAVFDAAGKALGRPVHDLLGGLVRDRISLSYSVAAQELTLDIEDAKAVLDDGFMILKIKTGVLSPEEDLERVSAIRSLVGPKFDLRIDFNQGGLRERALGLCRKLEAFNPTFIEQPVKGWDLAGLRSITQAIDTPVMADESVMSLEDGLKIIKQDAADMISIKLSKLGGIVASKKLAGLCEAAGVGAYAGAMWESGIGIAASLHFACSSPAVRYGSDFYTCSHLLEDDLIQVPIPIEDGQILVPNGPGLGVDVDWDAVERYRVSSG